MTQAEMRAALQVGPDWCLMWAGVHTLKDVTHICAGLHGPGGLYVCDWVTLRYGPTKLAGVEAAVCLRCRVAWVRAVGC